LLREHYEPHEVASVASSVRGLGDESL
jgi:hypothetical protein